MRVVEREVGIPLVIPSFFGKLGIDNTGSCKNSATRGCNILCVLSESTRISTLCPRISPEIHKV